MSDDSTLSGAQQSRLIATAFFSLFAIVGLVLYGLPMYYDFFKTELDLSYKEVTYGNAFSKVAVAILFGFIAGRLVDRIGPRRPMIFGILLRCNRARRAVHRHLVRVVSLVLGFQCPRLSARGAAPEPGALVTPLQADARSGDGDRLRRHRRRVLLRPADLEVSHRVGRVARRSEDPGGDRGGCGDAARALAARGQRARRLRLRHPAVPHPRRPSAACSRAEASTSWRSGAWPPSAQSAGPTST